MARRRFVHPDFFHDEHLVTMSPFTRLLFIGLWCLADREGRLEDKPLKIKMQLFPADDAHVESGLDELARAGMIVRYSSNSHKYLQVTSFAKYQHPHPRELPSTIPAPGITQALPGERLGVAQQAGYQIPDTRYTGPSDTVPLAHTPTLCAKPLGYRARIDVAWPGRPPVPGTLHAEFVQKLGGDQRDAGDRLRAWYPQAAAPFEDQPIGDDDFRFWRARFREWVGTTEKPVRASRTAGNADAMRQFLESTHDA